MSKHNLAQIQILMEQENIFNWGVAHVQQPETIPYYERWLLNNNHGDMGYLKDHLPMKKNPQLILPQAQSVIVIAVPYVPHPYPVTLPIAASLISLFAQGEDYHHWLNHILFNLTKEMKSCFPNENFLHSTDNAPFLEKDLGTQAGLGWFGKNTCLLNKKMGSYFFIGEILTTLELPLTESSKTQHCGSCRKCLDACPTGALHAPYELNARLCLAYLTIESSSIAPENLRAKFATNLFGCDICQRVCPWNSKIPLPPTPLSREELLNSLTFILSSSNKQLVKTFRQTPLSRAAGNKLKRNALYLAAEAKAVELFNVIAPYQDHKILGELASWCLKRIRTD